MLAILFMAAGVDTSVVIEDIFEAVVGMALGMSVDVVFVNIQVLEVTNPILREYKVTPRTCEKPKELSSRTRVNGRGEDRPASWWQAKLRGWGMHERMRVNGRESE